MSKFGICHTSGVLGPFKSTSYKFLDVLGYIMIRHIYHSLCITLLLGTNFTNRDGASMKLETIALNILGNFLKITS